MPRGFDVRGRALHDGELAAWLSEHSLGNRFAVAVVGTSGRFDATAVALAVVAADGEGRYIDPAALTPDDEAALSSWLADPGPPKALHDAKRAMHALAGRGWTLRGVATDTALAGHLLRPGLRELTLNDLLVHHMRCALPEEAADVTAHQWFSCPTEATVQALILRACAVLDLADVLDEELARIDSSSLLGRLELPTQAVLAEMETAGIAVARSLSTGVPYSVAADGRIHATFDQIGAVTGRIVCLDLPIPAADGPFRDAFVVGDGYDELMVARYTDIDTRLLVHLSGEAEIIDDARRVGYASTLLGRRLYLPDLDSADPQARQAAEGAALAMRIHGSAADIVKTAMINLNQVITAAGLDSRLLLQADDELVFEVAGGERDELAAHVRQHMVDAHPLQVPLEISVGWGPNWGSAAGAGPRRRR